MSKRENETAFTLWIDKDLYKQVKLEAIEIDSNAKEIICESLKQYFERKQKNENK